MTTADGRVEVLLLVKGLGLGGAERLIVEQATGSATVAYAAAHVRPDKVHFVAELEAAGVPVTCLGGGRPWPLALASLLRRTRPDVVHVHSPLVAAVARVLVRLGVAGRGTAVVSTEHNRWSAYVPPTRVANAVTMVLDHRTWAVSDEARGSIRPAALRRRVRTLVHGIDLTALRARAQAAPDDPIPAQDDGSFTCIHVANRRPEKAHDVLLEAFALAAAEDPDLRLWLVGQHLDEEPVAGLVARHPARGAITVLGYRSDAPSLVQRADVLVLSSDHEGLPVAVMEALALGRPVVSTAVGGVPEAVRDGIEGVLVPPRSPAELAAALVGLHRDRDRWSQLSAAARERAARFDAAPAQEAQEQAYAELVGRRRRTTRS